MYFTKSMFANDKSFDSHFYIPASSAASVSMVMSSQMKQPSADAPFLPEITRKYSNPNNTTAHIEDSYSSPRLQTSSSFKHINGAPTSQNATYPLTKVTYSTHASPMSDSNAYRIPSPQQPTFSTTSSSSSGSTTHTKSVVVAATEPAASTKQTAGKKFKPTTYYTSYANDKSEIDYSSYLYSDSTTEMYKKKSEIKINFAPPSQTTSNSTTMSASHSTNTSKSKSGANEALLKNSDIHKIDSIIDKVFANNNLYGKKLLIKENASSSSQKRASQSEAANGTRTVMHSAVKVNEYNLVPDLVDVAQTWVMQKSNSKFLSSLSKILSRKSQFCEL